MGPCSFSPSRICKKSFLTRHSRISRRTCRDAAPTPEDRSTLLHRAPSGLHPVVVGPIEHVQSTSVAGIGVENTSLRILIKNAEARAFLLRELTHLVVVIHLPLLQLF